MQCKQQQLLNALQVRSIIGNLPDSFPLIVGTDSRRIEPGSLFFALTGENFDAHNYVGSALRGGAMAAVVSRPISPDDVPADTAVIMVDDVLESMQSLAHAYLKWHDIKTSAVTGSVGKTTTKDLTAHFLSIKYPTLKTQGNFNNDIGLPLTAFALQSEHEKAVFELAMRGPGEIKRLARIVEPDYAIITNIAPVHLETLGSIEAIARAKCEVLEELAFNGQGIVNGDQDLLRTTARAINSQVLTFGWDPACDARVKEVKATADGMTMLLNIMGESIELNYSVPAPDLAVDFAAATICAYLQGIPLPDIAASLGAFASADKRLNITEFAEGGAIINDSYNASPLSMRAALGTLLLKAQGRHTVAVLGDMYELGALEKQAHRELGQEVARRGIDSLVCIGEKSLDMADAAISYGLDSSRVHHFRDRESAYEWLCNNTNRSNYILIKASRAMQLDELAARLIASDN